MIIKARRRDGFGSFSDYLTGEGPNHGENEECNFVATGNSLGIDSVKAWCIFANRKVDLRRAQAVTGRPLKKPLEHIMIRTRKGDILAPKMVLAKIPELLEALGYQNCPWVLEQHIKNGEPHYHLGVCRIDGGRIPDPMSSMACYRLAAKFARDFGFVPVYAQKGAKPYGRKEAKLAGLWSDTEATKPSARLTHFIKNGFIPTRGGRGQLVFVDKDGKPHGLNHIPEAKEKGLKQNDMPVYFGLTVSGVKTLPHCKRVEAALKDIGWKPMRQRIVRRIANEYAKERYDRYYGACTFRPGVQGTGSSTLAFGRDFTLPQLSPRHGSPLQAPPESLSARPHGVGLLSNAKLQPARGSRNNSSVDTTLSGRAQAAADAVSSHYAAAMEAIERDQSLTPDQRAAAIKALQRRQGEEASAARQKILDEASRGNKPKRRDYSALKH